MDYPEKIEQTLDNYNTIAEAGGFASELLSTIQSQTKNLYRIIVGLLAAIVIIVGAFVYLWLQYDYVDEWDIAIDATGFYTMIDSNGNIIAQDVTPEMLAAFEEWWAVNGENTSTSIPEKVKD